MRQTFTQIADPETSGSAANYNYDKAEALRQQALDGDLSWLPEVEVLSNAEFSKAQLNEGAPSTSGTPLGAFGDNTIFLNESVLSNPQLALRVYSEEAGHALDKVLNQDVDSAGDEGALFSKLLMNTSLSAQQLQALKAENDEGVLKGIDVEFFFDSFSLPSFDLPSFDLPSFDLPDFDLPDFDFPDFSLPDFDFSDIGLPDFEFPDISLPDFEFPDISLPDFDFPEFSLPDIFGSSDNKLSEISLDKLKSHGDLASLNDEGYIDGGFDEKRNADLIKNTGYGRVRDGDMPKGFTENVITTDDGFVGILYYNKEQDNYAFNVRGTENFFGSQDRATNGYNALGYKTGEYTTGIDVARDLQDALPDGNLILTGHSKGGGIVSAAALDTGLEAVTFNPAGLHDRAISEYDLNSDNAKNITAYNVENEILTTVQDSTLLDVVLGVPGTLIKNTIEAGQSLLGINDDPNFSVAHLPEAIGQRFEITAADKNGQKLDYFDKTGPIDRLNLHGVDAVIHSFKYEINQREQGNNP
jgi:hypothetical protein